MKAKATGIVRPIDPLGRVTIPMEIRKSKDLPAGTPMEFYLGDAGDIILKKYQPECAVCGLIDSVQQVNGIRLCPACFARVADRLPPEREDGSE